MDMLNQKLSTENINTPDINNIKTDNIDKTNTIPFNVKKNMSHWVQVSSICIIKILISIIAMILAWNCSSKENIILRILVTIISGLFGEFYILYYAIYRTFLGNKCYI
tara:strand:- start:391 stop:714 length:324 start_codon:yes stop_codon:yes gene_type:complete